MRVNENLKYFISAIIWTIGIVLIRPYEIPGDIRNQVMLGTLVTLAGFIPLYKNIISMAKGAFKKTGKTLLIEIDKRGILAILASEGIIIVISLIITMNPPTTIIDKIMDALLLVGGFGMALMIFIETVIIQRGENKNISASNDPI